MRIDSFVFHNRERRLGVFVRLNLVLAHSFLSVSEEGSFVWIAVEGGVICCAFHFDKEGLKHTRRCETRIFQRE